MAVDLNYGIGVEGKNIVLKTLGRVYIKVKDRKYELMFKPEDLQKMVEQYAGEKSQSTGSSIIITESSLDIDSLEYPGDDVIVISKDGMIYFTENNGFTEIPIKFSDDELTLENLYVSGQVIFTGNNIPIVIPNTNLIQNLNADLLDGYQSTDFAIKNQQQNISGNWTFSGNTVLNNTTGNTYLADNSQQRIYIDFTTGNIRCNTLSANTIDTPAQEQVFDLVSGVGNEVWVGSQINILESSYIQDQDNIEIYKFGLIDEAYESEYLPNYSSEDDDATEWTLNEFWYPLLFETYNVDEETYILKDFSDPAVIADVNSDLAPNYNINEFMPLIWALQNPNISNFTGSYYEVQVNDNLDIQLLLPNMMFKDNRGNIGIVVDRSGAYITVKMINENTSLDGDKLIIIGNIVNPGGIVLKSEDPSLSIVKDPLNTSDVSVYFGELSKIDNTKSGIGTILNGIGSISHNQITWTDNNDLTINGSDIINSRIDNTGISNSSFQSGNVSINTDGSGNIGDLIEFNEIQVTKNSPLGPAGGDLTGNYPNPTIANNTITEAKLDATLSNRISTLETEVGTLLGTTAGLTTSVSELQNTISTLQTNIQDLQTTIETLQTSIIDLQDRVTALESETGA